MISAVSHVDRIACIKIVLDHVEPAIWRRVEVPLTTSLRSLHEVIQAVMLFENYHHFDFTIEIDDQSRRYGIPDPDVSLGVEFSLKVGAENSLAGVLA